MVLIILKSVMIRQNISIRELARRSGVSKAEICNILKGKTMPRIDTLYMIAKALSVRIEELYKYD